MKTITKNLLTFASILGAICLDYFSGHIILTLLFNAQLVDLVYTDPITVLVIKLALGLPVLLIQIAVADYARRMTKDLF